MPTAEQVAAAWRVASPAAVHPELNDQGQPISSGSAENTIAELLNGINNYLPHDDPLTLLDYGGGPGRLARLAAPLFGKVIVADTNPAYLEIAARLPKVDTLLVDTVPETLPEADVILCVNLFLHLPMDAARALLSLFAETLPPHGLLALQLPLYDVWVTPATWTSVGVWTDDMLYAQAWRAHLRVLESHPNPGRYHYGAPGPNHARLHFLKRA